VALFNRLPLCSAAFFFQAEDGIRDRNVTGVRRVLFRSSGAEPSGPPPSAFRGRALRDPPSSGIEPSGPSAFRARACRHRPLEVGRGRPVREHRTMTAVFEPAELLTAALSALFLAVPLAVV